MKLSREFSWPGVMIPARCMIVPWRSPVSVGPGSGLVKSPQMPKAPVILR